MNFKLLQIDVKNICLNGYIVKNIYVKYFFSFKNYKFLNHIFKLNKALCELKQAPRAWYDRLSKFLLKIILK